MNKNEQTTASESSQLIQALENPFRTQSSSVKNLVTALSKAHAEALLNVVKDSVNPHFKNRYASLEACCESINGPLSKFEIVVTQMLLPHDHELYLKTQLTHVSGEWMASYYPIIPIKTDPQGYGSALSYARRYSLLAITNLGAEDDDAEKAHTSLNGPRTHEMHPVEYGAYKSKDKPCTEAQRKKLFAMSRQVFPSPEEAKDFMVKETGKPSSEDLTMGEIQRLFELLDARLKDLDFNPAQLEQ